MSANLKGAERKANEILSTISPISFPLNLSHICKQYGIKLEAISDDHISGKLDRDNKIIFINPKEISVRQRFTCAHELGHYFLHKDNDIMYRGSVYCNEPKELEANHFAACLLMPQKEFIKVFEALHGSLNALAIHFGVSRPAIAFRADYLTQQESEYVVS